MKKPIKKTKKGGGDTAMKIGAGLAVAAATAAAAGYYLYGSKNAKSHRAAAVKLATYVKKEVIKEAKRFDVVVKPKAKSR